MWIILGCEDASQSGEFVKFREIFDSTESVVKKTIKILFYFFASNDGGFILFFVCFFVCRNLIFRKFFPFLLQFLLFPVRPVTKRPKYFKWSYGNVPHLLGVRWKKLGGCTVLTNYVILPSVIQPKIRHLVEILFRRNDFTPVVQIYINSIILT